MIGYDIEKLVITEKQQALEITPDRIMELARVLGEDPLEDTDFLLRNGLNVFAGYLLARLPERCSDIFGVINDQHFDLLSLQELFVKNHYDGEYRLFYEHFCDFVNMTTYTKAKINQFMFSAKKAYGYD